MDGDDWFPLAELAGRLGGLVWVEEQLASLLASWSRIETQAPVAIQFSTAGRHHEWHAEIVRRCLPSSPQLAGDALVLSPTEGWSEAMSTLHGLADPDATSARLRVLVKILQPWVEREVAALLDLARPVSDAPMIRWLGFMSLDHRDDDSAFGDLLLARSAEPARFGDHALVHDVDLS